MVVTVIAALLMLVGMIGIVVPVLPGLVLVAAATALWALAHPDHRSWVVVGVSVLLYAVGLVTQYVVPGRRLKAAGVGTRTLLPAVLLAVVGFVVIPVVGALVGFVLGIFLVELARRRDRSLAWTSTTHALRAVGLSMVVELSTAFAIVLTWCVGLVLLGPGG